MKLWPFILAGVGGGLALLWARAAGARVPAIGGQPAPQVTGNRPAPSTRPAGPLSMSEEDIDYLARVLIMEAGSTLSDLAPGELIKPEGAGIAWVVYNRSRNPRYCPNGRTPCSIRQIVATTRWPGGGPRGESFVAAIQAPAGTRTTHHTAPAGSSLYPRALQFARRFANGEVSNPIGTRTSFVHPQSLTTCTQEGVVIDGRPCVRWERWGLRRTPEWALDDYVIVGRAVFSR